MNPVQDIKATDQNLQDLITVIKNAEFTVMPEKYRKNSGKEALFRRENRNLRPLALEAQLFSEKFFQYWNKISQLPERDWQRWFHTHHLEIVLRSDLVTNHFQFFFYFEM